METALAFAVCHCNFFDICPAGLPKSSHVFRDWANEDACPSFGMSWFRHCIAGNFTACIHVAFVIQAGKVKSVSRILWCGGESLCSMKIQGGCKGKTRREISCAPEGFVKFLVNKFEYRSSNFYMSPIEKMLIEVVLAISLKELI